MTKEKPCKGTNKDTYGLGCGKLQEHRELGLGVKCKCYMNFLRNTEAGRERVKRATLKSSKNRRSLEKAILDKKARTSLGALKEQTQRLFNRYIRLRDEGLPCISENTPYQSDFDAGHCFSVGSYDGLRYDYDNCHGQSIKGNRYKEGNHSDYLLNLPNRIGQERTDALTQRAKDYKKNGYKFTRFELLEIQAEIKEKIKQIK